MKKLSLFIVIAAFVITTGCGGKYINGEFVKGEYIPVEAVITAVNSEDQLTIKTTNGYTQLINISKLSINRELQVGMKVKVWLFDANDDVSRVDEEVGSFPNKIEIISKN